MMVMTTTTRMTMAMTMVTMIILFSQRQMQTSADLMSQSWRVKWEEVKLLKGAKSLSQSSQIGVSTSRTLD